jgi:hypothetical protein
MKQYNVDTTILAEFTYTFMVTQSENNKNQ